MHASCSCLVMLALLKCIRGQKKRHPEGSRGSRELLILLAGARQIDIERYL